MTGGIVTVFGILAGAVALFAWGRPRSDVVAILVVLALNLSGVLTMRESLAGFGDPVLMLIAAVAIVGEGLIATGVAYRLGEAHFMAELIDGQLSQNNGNWQWVAGTGADAQPFHRIFSPLRQGERFDPDGTYVKRWVPA